MHKAIFAFDNFNGDMPVPNGAPADYQDETKYAHHPDRTEGGKVFVEHNNLPWVNNGLHDGTVKSVETTTMFGSQEPWFYPVVPGNRPLAWFSEGTLFPFMSQRLIEEIRDGQCWLLLHQPNEGHAINPVVFSRFHRALEYHGLSPKKFIFVTGNHVVPGHYDRWCFEAKPRERINLLACDMFETYSSWKYATQMTAGSFVTLHEARRETIREKRFLCLMRRPREVRYAALLYMFKMNLLRFGHVSFPDKANWKEPYPTDICSVFPKEHLFHEKLMRHADNVQKILPLTVDQQDPNVNHAYDSEVAWPYLKTYFSLLPETLYDQSETLFLSEKIFKPLVNMHPFVMLASPGTLAYLREKGYQTFGEFWDESYDSIVSNPTRFLTVMKLVERLCAMDRLSLIDMYKRMSPILEHNRDRFLKAYMTKPDHVDMIVEFTRPASAMGSAHP